MIIRSLMKYLPIILMILVLFTVTVFALAAHLQHRGFYGRSNCSLCGQPTGFKGNRRYKLIGGCACETCATKLAGSKNALESLGPNWFVLQSPFGTVDDAMKFIRRLDQDEEVKLPKTKPLLEATKEQQKADWAINNNNTK